MGDGKPAFVSARPDTASVVWDGAPRLVRAAWRWLGRLGEIGAQAQAKKQASSMGEAQLVVIGILRSYGKTLAGLERRGSSVGGLKVMAWGVENAASVLEMMVAGEGAEGSSI